MDQDRKEDLLRTNRKKGTNSVAVRSYNERLVMQLVREHGPLTKAEATRATGLSANATSVIFRSLENDGLLVRGRPIRGRIGQPSTPLWINQDAHHYATLKVGRRSLQLSIVNFGGEIIASQHTSVPFPTPARTLDFVRSELTGVLDAAQKTEKSISAMAVTIPYELWNWTDDFGAPKDEMDAWRVFNSTKEIGRLVPWTVLVENDATAACRAELVFGSHADKQNWIYFFVGTLIGGGVVLNGSVYRGSRGNAGGFAPMRVPGLHGGSRLVDHASLAVLERVIAANGGQPFSIYDDFTSWDAFEPYVGDWIADAGRNLAYATVSALSILDFETVIVDGAIPVDVKRRLVDAIRDQLERTDLQGVHMPQIEAGQVGHQARTIGAAAALISASYMNDHNTPLGR